MLARRVVARAARGSARRLCARAGGVVRHAAAAVPRVVNAATTAANAAPTSVSAAVLPAYLTAPLRFYSAASAARSTDKPTDSASTSSSASTGAVSGSGSSGSGAATAAATKPEDASTTAAADAKADGKGEEKDLKSLKPREIVAELDRFIIGQKDAKRAVAIALRNRWRRHRLPANLKDEVIPKNILMVGPTGVGKTEIARRLAKIANAPFIKVEATKFTEVGFHGRDVDQIIKDLVEQSIQLVRQRKRAAAKQTVSKQVEERILDALMGKGEQRSREAFRSHLRSGNLENQLVELEVPNTPRDAPDMPGGGAQLQHLQNLLRGAMMGRGDGQKKKMTIGECRPLLEEAETEKIVSADESVVKEAIRAVEQDGIVFIDEIDKIANPGHMRHGPDASAEGVQRDLLPLIEGCSIQTKHGNVNTDHILFIASGAFHSCKPSDLLSELQGRLPIRVELKDLTEDDFYRILTEPETNLIRQQTALMATEQLTLRFDDTAIREIARVAREVNTAVENIGARRLHTVIERIVDELSFDAADKPGQEVVVGADLVKTKVSSLLTKSDARRFIL